MRAKPNLVIPLASSYDQRFPLGDTGAQAGYDQRKVNCYYELADNYVTGKKTLVLAKRPGCHTDATIDDYGSATQVPYLMHPIGALGAMPLLFVKDSNDIKAVYPVSSGVTGSVTILNSATYVPVFVSNINISGTVYYLLQVRADDSGVGLQKAYYSSNYSTWTEITDADFTGISHRGKFANLDGTTYIMGASGIYGSDLNSISAWSASNYIAKSTEEDYSQGLIPFNDRILAFSEHTCEQFYNAGNKTGSPLSRVTGRVDRVGLSARFFGNNSSTEYWCTTANRLFFLGKDSADWLQVSLMTYNGGVFERVSGLYEERLLGETPCYGMWPVTVHGQSAVGMLLTAPGATTARWLMFFPDTRSWFEWESTVFTPINAGTFFAGVGAPNKLYLIYGNEWDDDGTNYPFLTQFRIPSDDDEWKTMSRCGVQADTVSGATLSVKFNDGGAATYGSARTIDLAKARKAIDRCGTFRERYVQLSNTSDKQIRLRNFYANVT